jgi:hypothetical protein
VKDPDGQAELQKLLDNATDAEQARDLGKRLPVSLSGRGPPPLVVLSPGWPAQRSPVGQLTSASTRSLALAQGMLSGFTKGVIEGVRKRKPVADAPGSPTGAVPSPPPALLDQPAPPSHDKSP